MNIKFYMGKIKRYLTIIKRKKQLKAPMSSIISRDCVGGAIYHDLNQKFTSPTVNLYMNADEFLVFCRHLSLYCDKDTKVEKIQTEYTYPVGVLKREGLPEIKVFFMHYKTFDEAREKWTERCKRIKWDDITIVYPLVNELHDVSCLLEEFNKLPYKKVALINDITQSNGENTFTFTKKEFDYTGTENILSYKKNNKIWQWRYLDSFDYVEFINSGKIKARRT